MDTAEPIDGVEVGEVVGGYRLERLLGAGSVSRVFLGEHLRLGRKVAIKVLLEPMVEDERIIERFLKEARIVNDIRHPNIVDISDFIETEQPKRLALVMEHIEGPSLKSVIRNGRELSFVQGIGVVLQLVSACEAAHGAGVIHRDIKPDNLLLTADPELDPDVIPGLKVVDFGIAKIGAAGEKTATGMMIGTPAYMSPEQIAGKPPPSSATDVFAIGEVLYEVLTGQRAYPPGPISNLIQTKLRGEIPRLETPAVPGGVAIVQLVTRCLQLRMPDRPKLEEIKQTLLEVCPEAEVVLPRTTSKKKAIISEADTVEPPDQYVTRPRSDPPPAPRLEETRPEPNRAVRAPAESPLMAPVGLASASPASAIPVAPTAFSPLPREGVAAFARDVTDAPPPEETKTPIILPPTQITPPPATMVTPFDDSTTVVKRMTEHARRLARSASPRRRASLAVGAAALACVIAAVTLMINLDRGGPEIQAEAIAPANEPNVVAVPRPASGKVEIKSIPSGARVEDAKTGVELGMTPLTLQRASSPKRIRLSAPGYESQELDVPEGNVQPLIALEKTEVRPAKKIEEKTKAPPPPPKDNWKMGDF